MTQNRFEIGEFRLSTEPPALRYEILISFWLKSSKAERGCKNTIRNLFWNFYSKNLIKISANGVKS